MSLSFLIPTNAHAGARHFLGESQQLRDQLLEMARAWKAAMREQPKPLEQDGAPH
jgi:hypothetical protein